MDNSVFAPPIVNSPSEIIDGIHIYNRSDYNQWYEAEYSTNAEPWDYSHRAAELYRHIYSVQQIRRYNNAPQALLELGCSKGLMTEMLATFSQAVCAADISFTALQACKQRCNANKETGHCRIDYFVTTTPGLPFAANSFDVVTVCDGLAEWYASDVQKQLALKDIYRVLKTGGIAILTDCLMPGVSGGGFKEYETLIRNSPLSVAEISFLYDKPWYKLESLLKKTGLTNKSKRILSSISLAKILNRFGRFFGQKASRHIVVIARKD